MKVQNMISNKGTTVPNQFIVTDEQFRYFQSYDSIIAKKDNKNDKLYLDSYYWNYSNTTSKYRNIFLNETRKETEAKIKSGEYILCNLNWGVIWIKHKYRN